MLHYQAMGNPVTGPVTGDAVRAEQYTRSLEYQVLNADHSQRITLTSCRALSAAAVVLACWPMPGAHGATHAGAGLQQHTGTHAAHM